VGYVIEIIPRAEKEYLRLPNSIQSRIKQGIISLEGNPRPVGSKKLRESSFYRIRTGDYRIVYSIDDNARIVKVLSIAHRKEVYR